MPRHSAVGPSGVTVPRSTKVVSTLGVVLVLAGLALAGWQKLAAGDESAATAVDDRVHDLPLVQHILPAVAALLVVTCLVGILVLSRNKPPTR